VPNDIQTTAYGLALAHALQSNSTDAGTVLSIAIAAGQANSFGNILNQASSTQLKNV